MSREDRISAVTVHAYRRMRASEDIGDPHDAFTPGMRDSMREVDSRLEEIIDEVLDYFQNMGLDKETLRNNLEL